MKLNIRGMRDAGFWSAGRFFPKEGVLLEVVASDKAWQELTDAEKLALEQAGQITKSQLGQVRLDSLFLAVEIPQAELDKALDSPVLVTKGK